MVEKSLRQNFMKGIFWASLASVLWGISGTVLQYISQSQNIPAGWFLSVRTLGAGTILLIISFAKYRMAIFDIFKSRVKIAWLLAYSVFGLMANLFTFYMSVQAGNAAAATILQYLSPLFIVVGGLLFKRELPLRSDLIAFGISLLGVFLAITKGNIHELAVPTDALIWGILSGVTAAFYVVLPRPLVKDHSPMIVLGWGMFISGIIFNINQPFWQDTPPITTNLVLAICTVILVGTILAFGLLLYSLNFIPSAVASILDAIQPVVTFILSIIFLGLAVNSIEILGSFLVILAIYILQKFRDEEAL